MARHPVSGETREIWEGFSWPAFLFGWGWCFFKGLWIPGLVVLAFNLVGLAVGYDAGVFALIISSVILGLFGNNLFANMLLEQGFEPVRAEPAAQEVGLTDSNIDRLERLAALKSSGALTEEEFQSEKAKLIG